ncbi:MAG: DUF1549 domain-containing protein [Planctomycetota bacterium]|nr:MAG: DUF1549 domain-containing protein [Planctomycetota bacterium]REK24635.1 MAG: DUF1549 domain-containing protein [Planctomycetota bacterium]REK32427.1 MAG: DUF1549 domain-containing protein [Planctomycetota bacterium]
MKLIALFNLLVFLIAASRPAVGIAEDGDDFFESEVRPILVDRCYECHSEEAGERSGGLWLDRKAGWIEGGDSGPAIVPGKVDASLLIRSVRYRDEDLQMPPDGRLSEEEIATIEKWVAMGAPDPREAEIIGAVRREEIDYELARQGWPYRPHQSPPVPAVEDDNWSRNKVDAFVLAKLREKGLEPAEDATPEQLIRRVYYDLTGLPPTQDEVAVFAADPSTAAFAAIVDDLLSRPAFGEKWGRHWLDVARYADSNGGDRNFTYYQAWRYRNWVIDAFNRDMPWYEFVRAQLAGDLLPAEIDDQRREQLIAATFLSLGPKMLTERDKEKLFLDTADEQIDTMGRAFLGLTLGCARCHDHKFDPVSQEDYYALAGIFRSTEVVTGTRNGCVNVASWIEWPLPGPQSEEVTTKVERLELAMRLTVEKSYMKKAGGKMALGDLPLAGVIYDESDAELIGNWKTSTYSANRFGEQYIHDDQKSKGTNRAIFRGSLPESGLYEVRVAYNAAGNRTDRLPVTIEARDGAHQVIVDETVTPEIGGLFQPIGRFEFEKGGECQVIFETTGTEDRYVIVDAVQFIAVADIPREAEAIAAVDESDLDPLFRMSEAELKKELTRMIEDLKDEEVAMAPRDAAAPDDCHLRIRGEPGSMGPKIPRNFLRVLYDGPTPSIPDGQSGRLQLADWMVSDSNALLDRVIVNRVWHHLFARGIVASVDNFGRLGTPPTHPELLDGLALSFRENGGSIKSLIRQLVLSRTYQLSSRPDDELAEADPQNQWFGRQNRRRLTAEEIRDSILFFSGQLDPEPGYATATPQGVDLDKPFSFAKERKRTVYLPVARNNLATELAVFDAANPDLVSGNRAQTNVPTQALYLLNSDFVNEQATALGRLSVDKDARRTGEPSDAVTWLYRTLLGRTPDSAEAERALGLIADLSGGSSDRQQIEVACGHLAHVLLASTEFLYLD